MCVQALLFMSKAAPVYKTSADGQPQLTLRAVHRIGTHQTEAWTLVLSGGEADFFWQARQDLKPGTPLRVTANQIRAHSVAGFCEIVANVTAMGIATRCAEVTA